jgi:hypothetical protein
MAAKHAGAGDRIAALGGSPVTEHDAPDPAEDEGTGKHRKSILKHRHDAERRPESFERFRILMEVVDTGRRVVDLVDHKARYALAVMGVVNAGVFYLISRLRSVTAMPPALKPWLIGAFVVYASLSFFFVLHAIDCLRPRRLQRPKATSPVPEPLGGSRPLGLLFWESTAGQEMEAYARAWTSVRMEQLTAEQVIIAHRLAQLIRTKYVALGRLYWGLLVLVGLAALLLATYSVISLIG